MKEAQKNLKTLESALEEKKSFGGETKDYLQIAAGWTWTWTQIIEEIADVHMIYAETTPLLNTQFRV